MIISLENNVPLNNQLTAVIEVSMIAKEDVFIGFNCVFYDSYFHDLDKTNRKQTDPSPK